HTRSDRDWSSDVCSSDLIAWSPPRAVIGGDARIETTLPADGEYALELHDELFRPTGPGFFRLKVGELQYADLALPLGVAAGGKRSEERRVGKEVRTVWWR